MKEEYFNKACVKRKKEKKVVASIVQIPECKAHLFDILSVSYGCLLQAFFFFLILSYSSFISKCEL